MILRVFHHIETVKAVGDADQVTGVDVSTLEESCPRCTLLLRFRFRGTPVMSKLQEFFTLRDELALASQFHQDTDIVSQVNVCGDGSGRRRRRVGRLSGHETLPARLSEMLVYRAGYSTRSALMGEIADARVAGTRDATSAASAKASAAAASAGGSQIFTP